MNPPSAASRKRDAARTPSVVDLSFIIVNYKSSRELSVCLASIVNSEAPGAYEIRVVDNSEGDPGLEQVAAAFPQVHLTVNPENVGFARANNQAAQAARGRFLFFVNPDVVLAPETAQVLRVYLETHPRTAAVAPKVVNADGTLQYSCRRFPRVWAGLFNRYSLLTRLFPENPFSRHYLMTDFDHNSTREVDWVSGCCFMVRREAFYEAGMFDEHYFLFIEDVDLCRTLKDRGHAVVYHPATQVTHAISSSNHRLPPKVIIRRHQGMSYYHRKFMEGNPLTRALLDSLIALRCCSQLVLNLFR